MKRFSYMLAPVERFTDSCFRSICYDADLTFTEPARIQALARNNAATLERIRIYDDTPTVVQIMGQSADSLRKFLAGFSPERGFRGFNLNLGCPARNVVRQGFGCAMLKRVSKVGGIIDVIHDFGYGASVKMRLGLNRYEKEKKVYLNLINGVDADFFIVHARHGKETYGDRADWSVFPECIRTGKDIIANGDIRTKDDVERLKDCRGVMIGKPAIRNPRIFSQLKGLAPHKLSDLKEEYERLAKERDAPSRYGKMVLRYLEGTE